MFEFQNECLIFLQSLVAKLLERCPLQYPVVRYLVCLDPRYMVAKPEQAIQRMTHLLEKLMNLKQKSADDCDAIIRQYKTFISEVDRHLKEKFSAFKHTEDELDTFLFTYLGKKQRYEELLAVVMLLLTLSHGQAQVEGGFSTNKDVVSTNLAAETLIAFCRVYDDIQDLGLPMEQCVTSEMLKECKFAHSRYQIHMEEKKETVESEREKKRKAIAEELNQAERKKRKLESMLSDLEKKLINWPLM